MTKKIVGIWAQDEQGVIGKGQGLPWSLPANYWHFKQTTIGFAFSWAGWPLMAWAKGFAQATFPDLTRDRDYQVDNERVLVFHSVEEILDWYEKQDKNLYVIGGKQIFSIFESYLDEIVKTDMHASYRGDTYFPEDFDWTVWTEVASDFRAKDTDNPADFTIRKYTKKVI